MTNPTSPATFTLEEVPIETLRPDPANPRRISEDELEALTRSLRQFGFVQPVLARRDDGIVIGGHQRLVAARRLAFTSVPVIWLDLTPEAARVLGLALNKISGSWDDALLARLLAGLGTMPELDLSGDRSRAASAPRQHGDGPPSRARGSSGTRSARWQRAPCPR
jgi:hypothetical protein